MSTQEISECFRHGVRLAMFLRMLGNNPEMPLEFPGLGFEENVTESGERLKICKVNSEVSALLDSLKRSMKIKDPQGIRTAVEAALEALTRT